MESALGFHFMPEEWPSSWTQDTTNANGAVGKGTLLVRVRPVHPLGKAVRRFFKKLSIEIHLLYG